MIHFINENSKRLVGRNNQTSVKPLVLEYDITEQLDFQIISDNNQIIDVSGLAGLTLAVGLKQNRPSYELLALSHDFTIDNNTIKFTLNTYTTNWLRDIVKNNTEAHIEISQQSLNGKKVLLRDYCLVWPRTWVAGLEPEEIASNDYYTKEEVNELIEGLSISGYVTTEEFEEGLATKQDEITSENKLDYTLISGAPSIEGAAWGAISGTLSAQTDLQDALDAKADVSELPTKTSDLENDSDFITSAYVEDAISGKADISDIPTAVSQLDNDSGYQTASDIEAAISGKADESALTAHTSDTVIHVTAEDKTSWDAKLDADALNGYATESYVTEAISGKADKAELPTKLSDLDNDEAFITSSYVDEAVSGKQDAITSDAKLAYNLISGAPAIPTKTSDLQNDSDFITSAYVETAISGKADESALTAHTSDTVIHVTAEDKAAWTGKQDAITSDAKLDYDFISGAPAIPAKTSDLYNDSGFITITAVDAAVSGKQDKITAEAKLDYDLISGAPAIPTKTSDLENDSDFATSGYVEASVSGKADKAELPTKLSDLQNDEEFITSAYVETAISGKANESALTAHTSDTVIHVTADDKAEWSGKQNAITNDSKLSYELISGAPALEGVAWGAISGNLSAQTDLQTVLDAKASEASLTAHTSDATIHVTADDKLYWNQKLDEGALDGYATESYVGEYVESQISGKQDKITAETKLAYDLISGAPNVPTSTSQLTNDSGFATSAYVDNGLALKQDVISGDVWISAANVIMNFGDDWPSDPQFDVESALQSLYSIMLQDEAKISGKQDKITSDAKLDYDLISGAPSIPLSTSQLANDSDFQTSTDVADAISGKADTSALTAHTSDATIHVTAEDKSAWNAKLDADALNGYATESYVTGAVSGKQDAITAEAKLSYDLISGAPSVPTSTSQLTNDSDFQTSTDVANAISGKADESALTAHTSDTTIHVTAEDKAEWSGKQDAITSDAKLAYDLISGAPSVPTSTSQLTNDSDFQTSTDVANAISGKQDAITAEAKLDYSLVSGTPTIPTSTSQLTNDSDFTTTAAVADQISGAVSGKLDEEDYIEPYMMPGIRYTGTILSGASGNTKGYLSKFYSATQNWTDTDILDNDRKIIALYQSAANGCQNLRFPVYLSGAGTLDATFLSGEVKTWETWVIMGGTVNSFPNEYVISSVYVPSSTYAIMNKDDFPDELTFPSGTYTTHVFVTRYTRIGTNAAQNAFRPVISYAGSFSGPHMAARFPVVTD